MSRVPPSALIIDQGRRILLRLNGRGYELSQEELRVHLGLPPGSPGLWITLDRNRFLFEFADNQSCKLSAADLARRLARQLTNA